MTNIAHLLSHRIVVALIALVMVTGAAGIGSGNAAYTTVPLSPTAEAGEDDASGGEVTSELPPPDLPTANEQGYTYDLRVSLSADLDAVTKEAPVYELRRKAATIEQTQELADLLGMDAEATDRGDGTFEVSGNGQLFVSTDLIQFFSADAGDEGDLPNDEDAIAQAREWLRTAGILPPDLGDGRVVSRIDGTKRVIVVFGPAEPAAVLAAYPSISITLGPGAVVIEAALRWASVVRTDVYQLMPAKQAWQIVESGQAYIEANIAKAELEPGADVKGRATFTDISIAYSTSGPPGGQQYLQPIYVFTGKMRIEDKDGSFPVKAYVPGLSNSGAPVGVVIGTEQS